MMRDLQIVLSEVVDAEVNLRRLIEAREPARLALRDLSKLQREFDFVLNEKRLDSAPGSDWQRPGGCNCKKG